MVSTSCLRSIIMGKAYHENSVLSTEISMCSRIQLEVPKWNLKCIQPGSNLLMSFFSFSTPSKPLSLSPLQNKVRRKVQGVQTKNTHTLFRKARNNYPLSPFNWSGVRSCNHNLPRQRRPFAWGRDVAPVQPLNGSILSHGGSTHILPSYPTPFS